MRCGMKQAWRLISNLRDAPPTNPSNIFLRLSQGRIYAKMGQHEHNLSHTLSGIDGVFEFNVQAL